MSEDSAFGSADPTPTHRSKYSALEFNEDPFKDHRYGDPFDLEGADPFKNQDDPFTAPVSAAFGANVTPGADPFSSPSASTVTTASVSAAAGVDPFGSNWDTVSKTSSTSTAWGTNSAGMDPFGMGSGNAANVPVSNNLDDSFDPFSAKSLAKISQSNLSTTPRKLDTSSSAIDPFGSSSVWNDDPFSSAPVTRSKTSSDAFADFRNFDTSVAKNSTSSNNRNSNSVLGTAPKISGPPPNKTLNPLQKSETTSSVLGKTSRHWPSSSSHDTSSNSISRNRPSASNPSSGASTSSLAAPPHSEKEKKNKFKIMNHVPFAKKKDKHGGSNSGNSKVIKNDLGPSAPPAEATHLQMVSEASKKAELDRLERLRQQEERDLAYAIALSKAEAANQQ